MNSAVVNQFSSLLSQYGSQVFYQVTNGIATLSTDPGAGRSNPASIRHDLQVSHNQDYGLVAALLSPEYLEGAIKAIAFSTDSGKTFYRLSDERLVVSEGVDQIEHSVSVQVDNLLIRAVILSGGEPISFSPVLGADDFATLTVGLTPQITTLEIIETWLFSLAAQKSRHEFSEILRQLIPDLTGKEKKALISKYHEKKKVFSKTQEMINKTLARFAIEPGTEVKELLASQVPVSADNLALLALRGRTPEDDVISVQLAEQTRRVLATLTPKDEKILRVRFGISKKSDQPLEKPGEDFDVTRERIRQIEASALRKLRKPSRVKALEKILGGDSDDEDKKPE